MTVSLEVHPGGIGEIKLDRPERGNAIDLEMARELSRRAAECRDRDEVRVVLLTGAGGAFCVGGDLGWMYAARPEMGAALRLLADEMHVGIRTLAKLPKPLVAAVAGAVAGVGLSLACLADFVVAAEDAAFVVAYTAVGLSPDGGCSWMLPRLVGPRVAADLVLTNRSVGGEEALELGLATELVESAELQQRALDLGSQLSSGATVAKGASARLLKQSPENSLDQQLELEAECISRLAGGDEAENLVAAFLGRQ